MTATKQEMEVEIERERKKSLHLTYTPLPSLAFSFFLEYLYRAGRLDFIVHVGVRKVSFNKEGDLEEK